MTLRAQHLWLLALGALALRAPWLLLSPGAAFDLDSYARVSQAGFLDLYTSAETAGRFPYPPLWWVLLKALELLHKTFGGDFLLWSRLPALAGDLAISALLYLIVERRSRSNAALAAGPEALLSARAGLMAGLGWALNPLAALISVGHGQFDSACLALLLAAAWYLEYGASRRSELWAALCLGAAIAFKTWPAAFLPLYVGVFASRREALRFLGLSLLLPFVLLAPFFAAHGSEVMLGRLSYSGATALGFSGAIRASLFAVGADGALYRQVDDLWRTFSLSLLALAWAWAFWQRRRLRLLEGLPWVALTLVLLAPGLSPQYLVWPAAFSFLLSTRFALRYHLFSLPLLVAFYGLFMPQVLAGRHAWAPPQAPALFILFWAACNLAWWAWGLGEWLKLQRQNLTPRRGTIFR